jgi:hypothetical protein
VVADPLLFVLADRIKFPLDFGVQKKLDLQLFFFVNYVWQSILLSSKVPTRSI